MGLRPRCPQAGGAPSALRRAGARSPSVDRDLVRAQRADGDQPRTGRTDRHRRRRGRGRRPGAADVEQVDPRPIDQARLEQADGTRPVVAHSGVLPHPPQLDGTDSHLYFGWYWGDERTFPGVRHWPRLARFVTEFGAQAVPNDALFLDPGGGPISTGSMLIGPPALQKEFIDRVRAAERLRDVRRVETANAAIPSRRSSNITSRRCAASSTGPRGGFAQFCFADGLPAVTWSVLGHDRSPKLGYEALREACRPLIVVADRIPSDLGPGGLLELDIHVVSVGSSSPFRWRASTPMWRGAGRHWRFGKVTSPRTPANLVSAQSPRWCLTRTDPIALDLELDGPVPAH